MKDQHEIWLLLAKEKFPALTEAQLVNVKLNASMDWGCGMETELAKLFDSYIMMRNLYGIKQKDK
jgi:hypothetical protein